MTKGTHFRTRLVLACVVGAALAWASPSIAGPSLGGSWILQVGTQTAFVDVEQTGDAVSFTYDDVPLTGTVSAEGRLRMEGGTIATRGAILDGDVSSDGAVLSAAVLVIEPNVTSIDTKSLFGRRCGCVDGNTLPGDGCDAECQVEPCWTCAGTPSVCTRAADGAPCEAGACIAGSTCAAGVCSGGARIARCADMSGAWVVDTEERSSFISERTYDHYHLTVQQRGNSIIVGGQSLGTIDPATGTAAWTVLGGFYGFGICGNDTQAIRLPFSGTVALDGLSFTAHGNRAFQVSRCPLVNDVTEIGVRGNAPACQSDGAACASDACHSGESCSDGVCQAGSPLVCATGEHCEATRGCVSEPPGLGCPGDCNHDGQVTIAELLSGVNIALDRQPLQPCAVYDRDFDARLRIDELVGAVRTALAGCRP